MAESNMLTQANSAYSGPRVDFNIKNNGTTDVLLNPATPVDQWQKSIQIANKVISNQDQYQSMAQAMIRRIEGDGADAISLANAGKIFAVVGSQAQSSAELNPAQQRLLNKYSENGQISLHSLTELLMDADVARNFDSRVASRSVADGNVDFLDMRALTGHEHRNFLSEQLQGYSGDKQLVEKKLAEGSFSIRDNSAASPVMNILQAPIAEGYDYGNHLHKATQIYQQYVEAFGEDKGKQMFFDKIGEGALGVAFKSENQTVIETTRAYDQTQTPTESGDTRLSFKEELTYTVYEPGADGQLKKAQEGTVPYDDDVLSYNIPDAAKNQVLATQHYTPVINNIISKVMTPENIQPIENGVLSAISADSDDQLSALIKPILDQTTKLLKLDGANLNLKVVDDTKKGFVVGYVDPQEPNTVFINKAALQSIKSELELTGASEKQIAGKLVEELVTVAAQESFHLYQNQSDETAGIREPTDSGEFVTSARSKYLSGGRQMYEDTLTEISGFELTNRTAEAIRAQRQE